MSEQAQQALAVLRQEPDRLGQDLETTLVWMRLLANVPHDAQLQEEAERALRLEDSRAVIAACAALNAKAELRPLDAPPRSEGPEHRAAAAALAEIESLGEDGDPELLGYLWINRANALRSMGKEFDALAQEAYATALRYGPDKGSWWFDLGVLHKWRGRFQQGFEASLRARARIGDEKRVLWNIAICATACGEGDVAGGLWKELGLPVSLNESSGLPIVPDLPPMRLRVPSKPSGYGLEEEQGDGFEVVWVAPVSPCHGVVQSPTFRDAPVDYGDIVLWDGAPVAVERVETAAGPRAVPTFSLLEILRKGEERSLRFVAVAKAEALLGLGDDLGGRIFLHGPDSKGAEGERLFYGKLVVDPSREPSKLAVAWEAALKKHGIKAAMPTLYEWLGVAKRAGQEHQAWRCVERVAQKRVLGQS